MQVLKQPLMLYRDSEFGKEQNNLVSQSKPFDTIVRHIVEISGHDVMTYHKNLIPIAHEQRLWIPLSLSGISNPRPGLTPGTALRAVGSGIKFAQIYCTASYFQFRCTRMIERKGNKRKINAYLTSSRSRICSVNSSSFIPNRLTSCSLLSTIDFIIPLHFLHIPLR